MTEREYYARYSEDSHRELLEGRVVVTVSETDPHEDIFGFLLALLRVFLGEWPLGVVRVVALPDAAGAEVVAGAGHPLRIP